MIVLGVESSCDETGIAIHDSARGLLANALHSQVSLHAEYGGVVPELASRDHVRRLPKLLAQALETAGLRPAELDAVAYTAGPGLAGALLTGAAFAQAYALGLGLPVLRVHHLEGHLLSPLMADPAPQFPFVALLVSGGHTQLLDVRAVGDYRLIGESVDDAAGEAFDKTAKLLGLDYPGGPALARLAEAGRADAVALPRPMLRSGDLNFSFSGLKTAVLHQLRATSPPSAADLAASFQAAVIDVLVAKSMAALGQTGRRQLVVAGGVGANLALRQTLDEAVTRRGATVFYPPLALCTDNGAMIAFAGAMRLSAGYAPSSPGPLGVRPRWPLSELVASGH